MSYSLPPVSSTDTDVTQPASPAGRPWAAAWAATLGLILAALYWRILRDLVTQWWDDANYSHGFIVPVFSGYLIWRERDRLRALAPRERPGASSSCWEGSEASFWETWGPKTF